MRVGDAGGARSEKRRADSGEELATVAFLWTVVLTLTAMALLLSNVCSAPLSLLSNKWSRGGK